MSLNLKHTQNLNASQFQALQMQDVQPIHIYNTHRVNLPKCSFVSGEIMRDLMYFLLFLVLISNFTYKSSVSIKLTFLEIKWLYNPGIFFLFCLKRHISGMPHVSSLQRTVLFFQQAHHCKM